MKMNAFQGAFHVLPYARKSQFLSDSIHVLPTEVHMQSKAVMHSIFLM